MYTYSSRSEDRLMTCDQRLQHIFREIQYVYDVTIVCGYRGPMEQTRAFKSGNSKVEWPNGKHNEFPSKAIDVVPYPSMWDDVKQFYVLHGVILTIATRLGYKIRWGGDWDSDRDLNDQTFMDLGHFEIID